jgi:hypothetical protein
VGWRGHFVEEVWREDRERNRIGRVRGRGIFAGWWWWWVAGGSNNMPRPALLEANDLRRGLRR